VLAKVLISVGAHALADQLLDLPEVDLGELVESMIEELTG
jgi:hypothetical protein